MSKTIEHLFTELKKSTDVKQIDTLTSELLNAIETAPYTLTTKHLKGIDLDDLKLISTVHRDKQTSMSIDALNSLKFAILQRLEGFNPTT